MSDLANDDLLRVSELAIDVQALAHLLLEYAQRPESHDLKTALPKSECARKLVESVTILNAVVW
jgi:hypothetical protein